MQTQFGNWAIALGIDWTMPGDAREVRAAKKSRQKDASVQMNSVTGQRWLGFHAPASGKVYAGALLVAMVKPNAVVYQPLDENRAWVCAISDGMPVVGHDKILPASEARNTAIEWSSMFPQADMLGELSGAQSSLADVFAVLDEGLESKAIQKKQIAVALLNVSGVSFTRIGLIAGIALLAGGLAYGVTWYLDVRQKQKTGQLTLEQATRQSMASAQDKARQAAQHQASVTAFQAQVAAARAAQCVRNAPLSFWSGVAGVRQRTPLSVRGYRPTAYDCTAQACRVKWLGEGRFVSAADKLFVPNVERNLSADLAATAVVPFSVAKDRLPASRAKSADELRFLLQSNFVMHVRGFTVEAALPQTVNAPPAAGLPPAVVAEVGKWRAQLQGTSALLDAGTVLRMMAKWPIRVTSIKYQPGTGSVDLEGEFVYVGN